MQSQWHLESIRLSLVVDSMVSSRWLVLDVPPPHLPQKKPQLARSGERLVFLDGLFWVPFYLQPILQKQKGR